MLQDFDVAMDDAGMEMDSPDDASDDFDAERAKLLEEARGRACEREAEGGHTFRNLSDDATEESNALWSCSLSLPLAFFHR